MSRRAHVLSALAAGAVLVLLARWPPVAALLVGAALVSCAALVVLTPDGASATAVGWQKLVRTRSGRADDRFHRAPQARSADCWAAVRPLSCS